MDRLTIVLIIVSVVLAIGCLLLILQNVLTSNTKIDPSDIPNVKGYFGVSPQKTYSNQGIVSIVKKCGLSGTLSCTTVVNNLKEAIDYCNQYVVFCDAFIYSNGSVSIVDPTQTLSSDSNVDLYERQFPKEV